MKELTPRHLNIPKALASKYTSQKSQVWEELVSLGNEALVVGSISYDPTRGTTLDTWLLTQVKYAMLNHLSGNRAEARWQRLGSLDSTDKDSHQSPQILAVDNQCPETPVDTKDLSQRLLKCLEPMERALYVARQVHGETHEILATRLGVHPETIARRLKRIQDRLSRYAVRLECRRGRNTLKPIPPPRTSKQREAAARFCRERAEANRFLGVIPGGKNLWYAANSQERLLIGPCKTLAGLLKIVGLPQRETRGGLRTAASAATAELSEIGLRLIRGPEALELASTSGYCISIQKKE